MSETAHSSSESEMMMMGELHVLGTTWSSCAMSSSVNSMSETAYSLSESEISITGLVMILPLLVVVELAEVGDSSSSEISITATRFAAGGAVARRTDVVGVAAGEAAARRTRAAYAPSSLESSSTYTYQEGGACSMNGERSTRRGEDFLGVAGVLVNKSGRRFLRAGLLIGISASRGWLMLLELPRPL